MATNVTSKGQVTIPKKIRDLLKIGPGSAIEFELTVDGRVELINAAGPRPPSPFARVRGRATSRMSTVEIMALTRGDD